MSSSAFITINGYPLESTRNDFNEWFFKKSDRQIVGRKQSERNPLIWSLPDPGEEDKLEMTYVYACTARTLTSRLELAGYTLSRLEREFSVAVSERRGMVQAHDHSKWGDYQEHLTLLENASLNTWLSKLKVVVEEGLRYEPWQFDSPERHRDTIIDILINTPNYQLGDEPVFTLNFPCISLESFARAILAVVPEDAPCLLDVTDLVDQGRTDILEDFHHHLKRITNVYEVFENAASEIRSLLSLAPGNSYLTRILYANVVTCLETYLGDTLKTNVLTKPALLRRYVESHEAFRDRKASVAEVFRILDDIDELVGRTIDSTLFHNIHKVMLTYKNVFDVTISDDVVAPLSRAVTIRHHIVHRNGRDTAGRPIDVLMSDVEEILGTVEGVVRSIDGQIFEALIDDGDEVVGIPEVAPETRD